MIFEFDENKSILNKEKHGIDFIEIQQLFLKDNLKIKKAKTIDNEIRYSISEFLNTKCWTVIFTLRKNNIRIISARRCREKGVVMINMTAKEFDKKFENHDIDDLMDSYEVITLNDLKKELKNNSLNISLSQKLLSKLQQKANELNLTINDTIKVLLAKELGVL